MGCTKYTQSSLTPCYEFQFLFLRCLLAAPLVAHATPPTKIKKAKKMMSNIMHHNSRKAYLSPRYHVRIWNPLIFLFSYLPLPWLPAFPSFLGASRPFCSYTHGRYKSPRNILLAVGARDRGKTPKDSGWRLCTVRRQGRSRGGAIMPFGLHFRLQIPRTEIGVAVTHAADVMCTMWIHTYTH